MSRKLWTEEYRPTTLDEYVWRDQRQRQEVEKWLADGALPHLLFSGIQGTGKTSLALLLLKLLGIPKSDICIIYASRERKIEVVQERVSNFVGQWALGPSGIKYVVMDEADALSPLAQKFLRSEMEVNADICRFILTCNYPKKIIPAISSRIQGFHFEALEHEDYVARAGEILMKENVEFDVDNLMEYANATYPDLRKLLNNLQQHSNDGVLAPYSADEIVAKDYLFEMADLFKQKQFLAARKLIVEQAQLDEYDDIYRFLYKNLNLWGSTESQQDEALLVIREGLVHHGVIADAELNLSATLVKLSRIAAQ